MQIIAGIVGLIALITGISFFGGETTPEPQKTEVKEVVVESVTQPEKEVGVEKKEVVTPTPERTETQTLSAEEVVALEVEAQEEREAMATPQAPQCHPSYSGCLNPNASDYDCAGGSGDGPYYTGPIQVIGYDEYKLDRDGDGWACE